jgi:hypothetical protein
VRKDLPLLVCRSTVAADELVPAADVPDDADDADDDADDDDGDDGEDADDAEPEPPELQAASTTPAAASGSPNLIASGIFPDDNSGLFMGCAYAFPFRRSTERMPRTTQYATAAKAVRPIRYVSHHRVIPRRGGNSIIADRETVARVT